MATADGGTITVSDAMLPQPSNRLGCNGLGQPGIETAHHQGDPQPRTVRLELHRPGRMIRQCIHKNPARFATRS